MPTGAQQQFTPAIRCAVLRHPASTALSLHPLEPRISPAPLSYSTTRIGTSLATLAPRLSTPQLATMATAQSAHTVFPSKQDKSQDPYIYQVGFGNSFASEAVPGTLPLGQNSPQKGASRKWGSSVAEPRSRGADRASLRCSQVWTVRRAAHGDCLRRLKGAEPEALALPHEAVGRAPRLHAHAGQPRRAFVVAFGYNKIVLNTNSIRWSPTSSR